MLFLDLPLDVRLVVYRLVLADHQRVAHARQPSNAHLSLRHACRQIYRDARLLCSYVSLRNEPQIERFYYHIASSPESALSVRWADVANDGRVLQSPHNTPAIPASQLYRTLAKLPCLETLRVFDARHYHPFTASVPQLRYHLDFEGAMYPPTAHSNNTTLPRLTAYELYLDPSTRVTAFDRLPSHSVRSLRLSGDCRIAVGAHFPALRHLTLRSVTSNTFDTIRFNSVFAASQLESFTCAQGHRLGFEIRNIHLESLLDGPGRCLQKLVLLGSTRITTPAIAACLRSLPTLEYFALSLVTVNELRENFILALGPSLQTLKLQVIHAWYAVPLFEEERVICNSLEERILTPNPSLRTVYVSFHSHIMSEDGREERWKHIAHSRRLMLKIGPWEEDEDT